MAVKTSKYRFTKPTPCTKAKEVINISATSAIWDSGNFLAVNEKHIAIPWAQMGAVVILGHHDYGKVPTTPSTFVGHTGPVIDLAFNPFNPDMLVTASEDATIKTWKIPETGLKGPSNGPVSTLAAHSKKVGILSWHPAAHNVLASSGPDSVVNLWDVQVEAPKIAITTHKDQVFGVQWNLDGTLLATTSKDKKVNVIDSRTGEIGISADAHQGSKTQRLVWAKRRGLIVTVGFNRQQFRQAMVWDIRNMEKPVCTEEIDQQSSVMAPYIDEDTNVLYIAGKGDGTIKFYELWDDAKPITYVNQFATNDAQRGIALMPKKSLDIKSCEVARIYRLTPKMLHHISFTVPRKTGETEFQEDLFPPTFADVPAIDADAFFSGKNAEPNLVSLQNLFTPGAASTGIIAGKVVADSSVPASPSKGGAVDASSPAKASNEWDGSSEPTPAQLTKQRDEIATLKAALEAAEKKLATMESKVPKAAEVKPVVEEAKPVAPAESTPAATEAKPVEAKPAETKPVEAKPVEVAAAKPSEEPAAKPAEEKPTTVVAEEHKSNGDAASEPAKPAEEAVKPAAAEDAPKAEEPKAAESTA